MPLADPSQTGELPAPGRPWSVRFVLAMGLVAVAAAGFAIAFRVALDVLVHTVSGAKNVVEAMHAADWWWRLGVPVAGALFAGIMAKLVATRGGGSVGSVMEAVALGTTRLSIRVALAKSVASLAAMATGGSIGREGPLIQVGGVSGQAIGEWLAIDATRKRVLIAAGTAAGFAAAYNTPLAAVVFVLEIVTGIVVVETVVPTLIVTVLATAITRSVVGAGPLYGVRAFAIANSGELAAFAGVGLVAALVAVGFTRLLMLGEKVFARPWLPSPWRQALGGLGAGAIIVVVPDVAGNGYEPLGHLLDGRIPIAAVAVLVVAKALATTSSVASGSPGGVFTPVLLLGGCTGFLCGSGLDAIGLDVGPVGGYTLVGMAAAIAAATHAPLMAAVIAFELSGDYAIVLPLVLATALAATLARAVHRDSIYTAELRARWTPTIALDDPARSRSS